MNSAGRTKASVGPEGRTERSNQFSDADHAVGLLEKNDEGRLAVTTVTLNPVIVYDGRKPAPDELAQLHDKAHHLCFIANSVKTRITVTLPTSLSELI